MTDALRLAYFSPLPPQRTGIADYSGELLPFLAQHAKVALFTDEPAAADSALREHFAVHSTADYGSHRWEYDVPLYQMGNSSAYHKSLYHSLLRYPGIVVLHDWVLHHFVVGSTVARGDMLGYMREMGYALGAAGFRRARQSVQGSQPFPWYEVPLNDRLLDVSQGVIVHSKYVKRLIAARNPGLPLAVVAQPVQTVSEPTTLRHRLPWPEDGLVFASLGQVTEAKRVDQILRAFARLRQSLPNIYFLIVGEWQKENYDLSGVIRQLGLGDEVRCTGFVDNLSEFLNWTATADIVINLRYPTAGETSATALRALAAGRPLIVSDHGWYSELPDAICRKVPVNDERALLSAMRRLATDTEQRRRMGLAAARHIREHHSLAQVAKGYVSFIKSVLEKLQNIGGGSSGRDARLL